MNVITQLIYSIHRILGTLLCILFLMWFLSAFVMMYHRFPRVNAKEKLQKQEILSTSGDSLPDIASVIARLPHKEKVRNLTLDRNLGQTVFHIRTNKGEYNLPLSPADSMPQMDNEHIRQIAALWCSAPIARMDTIHSLDQWIPFGELKKEMPIYKIHFADDAQTQLYLSSRNGEALQFSNRNERFWAWMGAIPHWVYFTWLRQDTALWNKTVIWLSGLSCIMVIAGIWVTIDIWCKTRRNRHHRFSPYRKKWYHWHYMTGIFFGIFVLTFTFSGMMSLADIPEWIHKPALKNNPARTLHAHAPQPDQYTLDYRSIIAAYPQALQIEWSNFREHPYYTVKDGKTEFYIDAADSLSHPLQLSEDEIRRGIESIYASDSVSAHHSMTIRMSQLNHFETYYRDMSSMYRGRPQLPVWKVTVEDADRSVYYIHPETGIIRHVDISSRWKYWSYTALHRMRLPGLNSNATLRKTILWALLLGGTVVSVTGLALSINYLRRICRRIRKSERYIRR
ncbi:PepSY-associated TM helix domain-containing protein [Bacteroides sp.]|uniref:PepSY-associated TM helix domain-containing protein n=1 Tax=Bacteroides sp. TaxID=29523 RepID=UPI00260B5376|nr:PepSY-associated TM helix domain-containing protein [Bacteroides sp.]